MGAVWLLTLALVGCGRFDFGVLRDASTATGSDGSPTNNIHAVQSSVGEPAAGPTRVTVALETAPAPGNFVVVYAASFILAQGPVLAIGAARDAGGRSLELVVAETAPMCSGGVSSVAIYSLIADATTTGSITVTAIDATAHAASHNVGPSSDVFGTSATPTLATAPELVVAAATDCSGNPGQVAWTDLDGYDVKFAESDTNIHNPTIFTERIVDATTPVHDDWRADYSMGSTFDSAAVLATFR